jgi:hypothetical protein
MEGASWRSRVQATPPELTGVASRPVYWNRSVLAISLLVAAGAFVTVST